MVKSIKIDPTQPLDEDKARALDQLLRQQTANGVNVSRANTKYQVTLLDDQQKKYKAQIELSHDIVHRKIKLLSGKFASRYSVLGKLLGKGAEGEVYDVPCTLAHQKSGGILVKTNKPRVVKISTIDELSRLTIDNVQNEAALLQQLPHLRAKELVLEQDEYGSTKTYLVMRKFEQTLDAYLRKSRNELTVDQRIQLSINLLRALQEQIHEKGVIHRDIKPNNILVNPKTLEVIVIDVGLGLKANEQATELTGTPPYMAPESFDKSAGFYSQGPSADTFAMGLVISQVWDAKPPAVIDVPLRTYRPTKKKFIDLFSTLNEEQFDSQERVFINNLLDQLVALKPTDRSNTADGVDALNQLKLHRLLDNTISLSRSNVTLAFSAGMYAAKQLKEIELAPAGTINPLIKIANVFAIQFAAIDDVTHDKLAIKAFIDAVNIKAFASLQSPNDIIEKTSDILKTFSSNMETLMMRMDEIEKEFALTKHIPALREPKFAGIRDNLINLMDDANALFKKHANYTAKLDDINELNNKIAKQLPQIKDRLGAVQVEIHQSGFQQIKSSYSSIIESLAPVNDPSEVTQLKNQIKMQIREYINSTLTLSNIKKGDRAASTERVEQINTILSIINDKNIDTKEKTVAHVTSALKNMNLSMFDKSRFGSKLYNSVKKAIEPTKTSLEEQAKKIKK